MEKGVLKETFYRLAGLSPSLSRRAALHASRQWAAQAAQEHRHWQTELEQGLRHFGLSGKLRRFEHHTSHAANAYYTSGFERALIVTLDGYGSGLAGSISVGEQGRLRRLQDIRFPFSLGSFYEQVTSSLGFNPDRHAGKIVGLAAYGEPRLLGPSLLRRFDRSTPGSFAIHQSQNVYFSRHLASRFPMIDVAAAYQWVLEQVASELVGHWATTTGIEDVVLSGGVAANVKTNQRIYELEAVRRLFVYPNMGDGGCGTGLGLLLTWPGGVGAPLRDVYLGPSYGEERDPSGAREGRVELRATRPLRGRDRAQGSLGRGGRALRWPNGVWTARARQPFDPLPRQGAGGESMAQSAPGAHRVHAVRARHVVGSARALLPGGSGRGACRGVHDGHLRLHVVHEGDLPAAVHVDGTARPQLIRREISPDYYDILSEYEKLSGIPSIINTSFNMHEEPIVCTPADAVRAFLAGNLTTLAIGPFLVRNPASGSA